MLAVTQRQQRVLDAIKEFIASAGFPPTRAELSEMLGFKSPNAAEMHLRALEKKGQLTIGRGSARAIWLTDSPDNDPMAEHVLVAAEIGML